MVLFRCEGSSEIGLGHVFRCLALAEELKTSHHLSVAFAMQRDSVGAQLVEEKGWSVAPMPSLSSGESHDIAIQRVIRQRQSDVLVIDCREVLSRNTLRALKSSGVLIVTIDDPTDQRIEADMTFHPPVSQVDQLDWDEFSGDRYIGWDWVVLRRSFGKPTLTLRKDVPVVLIMMGGSDPHGWTIRAMEALDTLNEEFEPQVILGPSFTHMARVNRFLAQSRRTFRVHQHVNNVVPLMAQADVAIASFGMTAYELAALGVPSIYLCLTTDHEESAQVFVQNDFGVSAGMGSAVPQEKIAMLVGDLLDNKDRREKMGSRAKQAIDGKGAERIAEVLASELQRRGVQVSLAGQC